MSTSGSRESHTMWIYSLVNHSSVDLTSLLTRRWNVVRKRMTYSQRDVPGLTRAAIPLLAKAGVKGVTVGENGACAPVNVPPIFLWRDNATGTEVIAL
jgi:hypothetical protein